MDISRRVVLRSSSAATLLAAGAAVGQIPSCSTTTSGTSIVPAVLDELQKAVAAVCPVIPAVTTLVSVVAAAFPAVAGVATITSEVAQQVANTVCKLVEQSGAAQAATTNNNSKLGGSYTAKLGDKEVAVHGFHIVNGKPVWF